MPEHQTIEYKESWHDEFLEWICGYANAYGGTLYIGKNDNGDVVGFSDKERKNYWSLFQIKLQIQWALWQMSTCCMRMTCNTLRLL